MGVIQDGVEDAVGWCARRKGVTGTLIGGGGAGWRRLRLIV